MPRTSSQVLPEKLLQDIQVRLAANKRIRRTLPMEGRLHIDRKLPFLVVYRHPANRSDKGSDRLVKGEASYLVASAGSRIKPELPKLLRTIIRTLRTQFEAFLIIEIWSSHQMETNGQMQKASVRPGFRLITSSYRPPTKTVEALEKALKQIRVSRQQATVEVIYDKNRSPSGLPQLLPTAEMRKLNCFVIGLEVKPIYRDLITGDVYPLLLRRLHRGVATALKRAVFEFTRNRTSHRPKSYKSLGRRSVVKAVWEVDQQLAEINDSFDFLLQMTPVNLDSAWSKFKKSHFEHAPILYYRPLPIDPALIKRKLYEIRIERVEDPTLAFLFREKRMELDRQLTMLFDRGKREIVYGSIQLYGPINDKLVQTATDILEDFPPRSRDESLARSVDAKEFAKSAEKELDYYRQFYPGLPTRIEVRDDVVGLMVSRGNMLIGKRSKIAVSRIDALIQHEIGTHVLTYLNGKSQPFRQLYCGLAGYEELQEGLAVLAEYLAGGLSRPRLRLLAGRVLAATSLLEGASFIETFRELNRTWGFEQRTAFTMTVRTYRGGGLTKDAIYLRGLAELLDYLKNGGKLEPLFVGKIGPDHFELISELQHRQILTVPPLHPRYMTYPASSRKLQLLAKGLSPKDLIERNRK